MTVKSVDVLYKPCADQTHKISNLTHRLYVPCFILWVRLETPTTTVSTTTEFVAPTSISATYTLRQPNEIQWPRQSGNVFITCVKLLHISDTMSLLPKATPKRSATKRKTIESWTLFGWDRAGAHMRSEHASHQVNWWIYSLPFRFANMRNMENP